jgi:hypothetical protein
MPTTLPSRTDGTAGSASRLKDWLIAAYCVSLVVVCSLLVVNGPQMRAAAEAQRARVVEQENKTFCSKFGIGLETPRYAECAADLMEIRRLHEQRVTSDVAGIL